MRPSRFINRKALLDYWSQWRPYLTGYNISESEPAFSDSDFRIMKKNTKQELDIVDHKLHLDESVVWDHAQAERIGAVDENSEKVLVAETDIPERKQGEQEVKQNEARLETLLHLYNMYEKPLEEIIRFVVDACVQQSASELAFLGLMSDDQKFIDAYLWSKHTGSQCNIKKPTKLAVQDAGLWAEAIRKKQIYIVNDYSAANLSKKGMPADHVKLTRFMSVPLVICNKVVAVIGVANKSTFYRNTDGLHLTLLLQSLWEFLNRKKLEEKLRQSQNMEAIGTLAGGIAHDFNNILYPIIGLSELLMGELSNNSEQYNSAKDIYNAGKRAADLVKQLLSFSRQANPIKVPLKIQSVLKENIKLMRSTIPADIEIILNLQKEGGRIMGDATQLHQIFMNLITNAFHAVEETGGKIYIRLKETVVSDDDLTGISLPSPGQYAEISVSDTGKGIAPEQLCKIFDPFFTTKDKGKGTGLGLSIVYGLVKGHGGDIKVYSEFGEGTTFNVYFPLLEGDQESETSTIGKKILYETGNETILLVDDEELIVRLEKQMLENLGYKVEVRTSSTDALRTFKAAPEAFDLVITDMAMPNMAGDKFAQELLLIRPSIPIILCTGFSNRINAEKANAIGIKGFLMKPILNFDMARMVRMLLDASRK